MFQAEIHLRQEKECILSQIAGEFDISFEVAIEELHDHLVTFVIKIEQPQRELIDRLESSPEVKHVEKLSAGNYLVTKRSCGAYSAIDQNHGVLRRHTVIAANQRVYSVLLFRREDLRAMIESFQEIGSVTLGKLSQFDEHTPRLTDRQREVIQTALERGYFEWPRTITSEELADELGIDRTTALEHLRKAESKLLTSALETGPLHSDRTQSANLTTR